MLKRMGMLLLCGLLFPFIWGCKNGVDTRNLPQKEEKIFSVIVSSPSIKDVEYTLEAVGTLMAYDETTVSSEIDVRIEKILVDEGSPVKKNDLLVRLDEEKLRYELERAEAILKRDRADLINAERLLKRRSALFKEKVIPEQMYDDTVTMRQIAMAQAEKAQAELHLARRRLKDTRVTAPIPGKITKKIVCDGEYVKEGDPLVTIVNADPIKLSFSIPERYITGVKKNQEIRAKVSAYPKEEFKGIIYSVNPKIDPETRTVEVKAYIKNHDDRLKPGFFAEVSLVTKVNKDALLAPEDAVIMEGGKYFIFLTSHEVAEKREVTIGKRFTGFVEILSGLEKDDSVIKAGHLSLYEGAKLKIQGK